MDDWAEQVLVSIILWLGLAVVLLLLGWPAWVGLTVPTGTVAVHWAIVKVTS